MTPTPNAQKIWDVVVIGGGPAGMMAAGRAAERGKRVLLLEKNAAPGKKLLITGGGRCNVTNHKLDINPLVASYTGRPKALYSAFTQFAVADTLNFFNARGMSTKVEAEDRVFPTTDRAQSVWDVLVDYVELNKVTIRTNAAVTAITFDAANQLFRIQLRNGEEIAKACIVATGGTSHPETGSTGDGFQWLESLGHTIIANNFALVPVTLSDTWVQKLAGITLPEVKLSIWQDGKKQGVRTGKLLFTHFGISGPTVLNMSSQIGDLLQYGAVILELDLFPELDHGSLQAKLLELLTVDNKKKIKNTLNKLVPTALANTLLELAKVDADEANHSITKEARKQLTMLMKALPLHVKSLLGADKAIVSSGGVAIDEINFQTMMSRIVPNLYVIGDVLNIDRPSGGYSLQLCWTTGFVAGDRC